MKHWIAIASANHVEWGIEGGFMQVCHGKGGPLKRLSTGDGVIYYSPTKVVGDKETFQHFTALGHVKDGVIYQVEIHEGFHPYRRDVVWKHLPPVSIRPLLGELEFSVGKQNWAYPMRFGLFEITKKDFICIEKAMETISYREIVF